MLSCPIITESPIDDMQPWVSNSRNALRAGICGARIHNIARVVSKTISHIAQRYDTDDQAIPYHVNQHRNVLNNGNIA